MDQLRRRLTLFLALVAMTATAAPARAIIVFGGRDAAGNPADTGSNLNPPPANLGDYEGHFGSFLGTPVAPRYFLTASHLGDAGNGLFTYHNGTSTATTYHVTNVTPASMRGTDLALWQIAATDPAFSLYAPLYAANTEKGNAAVMIGNGTARGPAINNAAGQPVGWQWAGSVGQSTWGTSSVADVQTAAQVQAPQGFGGDFLILNFDKIGDPDRGSFSPGDSGGATFVYNPSDHRYELAGVNSLVDGQFYLTKDGPAISGAIYDLRGFYYKDEHGVFQQIPDQGFPVPISSYASRVSSAFGAIYGVTGVPEPGSVVLLGVGLAGALGLASRSRRSPGRGVGRA